MIETRNWTEWMKGICLIWSRSRHFSPSMPGDRYLKLGSKSDHRAEISGNIVRYDALAPRPEVLRSFSCLYANQVKWYFVNCMCKWTRSEIVAILVEKYQRLVSSKYNRLSLTRGNFEAKWSKMAEFTGEFRRASKRTKIYPDHCLITIYRPHNYLNLFYAKCRIIKEKWKKQRNL